MTKAAGSEELGELVVINISGRGDQVDKALKED